MDRLPIEIVKIIFGYLGIFHWENLAQANRRLMGISVGRRDFGEGIIEMFFKKVAEGRCRDCWAIDGLMDQHHLCATCFHRHECFGCRTFYNEILIVWHYENRGDSTPFCIKCVANWAYVRCTECSKLWGWCKYGWGPDCPSCNGKLIYLSYDYVSDYNDVEVGNLFD
jgi:hypothetical protein